MAATSLFARLMDPAVLPARVAAALGLPPAAVYPGRRPENCRRPLSVSVVEADDVPNGRPLTVRTTLHNTTTKSGMTLTPNVLRKTR